MHFHLDYDRQTSAVLCPDQAQMEMLLGVQFEQAQVVTDDPYELRRVAIKVSRRAGAFVAEAAVHEGDELRWTMSPIESPATKCDCFDLLEAVALSIATELRPFPQPEDKPAPVASKGSSCGGERPSAKEEPAGVAAPASDSGRRPLGGLLTEMWSQKGSATGAYADFDPSRPWSVGLSFGGVLWEASTLAPTPAVFAGYRYHMFSANAEVRVVVPVDAGGFKPGVATISLLPCLHWRFLYGCLNGTAGYGWVTSRFGTAEGDPYHKTAYYAIGGRVGLDLPITEVISAVALVDVIASTPLLATYNYKPRPFPADVFGQAAFGMAAHF